MKSIMLLLVVVTMVTFVHGRALDPINDHRRTRAFESCKRKCMKIFDACIEECRDLGDEQNCRSKCRSERDSCTGERTSDDAIIIRNLRKEDDNPDACSKLQILAHETKQEARRRELGYYF